MIDITDISVGWATLKLGYCSFDVSYLRDLKYELDYLLDIKNDDRDVRKIILEGEGHGDLTLISYLTFEDLNNYLKIDELKEHNYGNVLNIIWQPMFSSDYSSMSLLKFPFDKFKEEYNDLVVSIKEDYITSFICPYDDEERNEAIERYDESDVYKRQMFKERHND